MQRFGVESPGRVAAVRSSRLLEQGPDVAFDRMVRLASAALKTPTVVLTVVDDTRSVLKGQSAPGAFGPGVGERPVGEVPCQLVVDSGAEVCVADIELDPRLRDLAQLRELGVRAFLGRPVHDPDGYVLGNLCATDTAVRRWTGSERESLHTVASAVGGEIALRRALRDSERHAAQLSELAGTLEQSLVPARVPSLPGVEIGTSFRAGGTGVRVLGDFYDVVPGHDGFGMVIGDVSGHGAAAARTTAMARSSVRTAAHLDDDPVAVLQIVNEVLRAWFDGPTSFVTAAYARLCPYADTGTGRWWEATVAGAGHPPGFVLRAGGGVELLEGGGTVLGVFPAPHVGHQVLRLAPGDSLVLHTDGITEARRSGDAEQFEESGVATALSSLAGAAADQVAARIAEAAAAHARGVVDDDAGVLVVRISPP